MQRLVFQRKSMIDWQEAPDPKINGLNQAVVKPIAIARCDLDLPIIHSKTLFRPPFAIGHEFIAEIVEVSEDMQNVFPLGTKVAVSFQVSCGHCLMCNSGISNSCETVPLTSGFGMPPGANHFGGALADLVHIPYASQMLLKVPQGIDPISIASLSDNISEVWKLAGKYLSRIKSGSALVVGGEASSIGLYTALFLHQTKQVSVLYIDTDRSRIDFAESLGIPVSWNDKFPKSAGRFNLVCDASASIEGWNLATRSLAAHGILTSASIFWTNKLSIPYLEFYNIGVEVQIGRVDSKESMPEILKYIETGEFTPGRIVTQTADFANAKEAWMEPSIKLVVTNN
ncbi:MAG: alcohol dehydrogenase catalytic domain-containing protein [Leptospiraceae bacterium]|nr:alcohol dehydrogenase catalytic domain-containing protein [Leptospiraceae bacterium]